MGSGGIDSFYRPLQTLAYYFIYQYIGPTPEGFHIFNIFVHALNGCLVYILGTKMNFSKIASWAGALIWLSHPIHTECVAYVSATADPLYVFFTLCGLITVCPHPSFKKIFWACLFFFLALLSKESSIVFPALAAACLYIHAPPRSYLRYILSTWPLWLMAIGYIIIRKTLLHFNNSYIFYKDPNIYTENILFRTYTFFATIPSYLKLLLFPSEQHFDRHFEVFNSPLSTPVLMGMAFVIVISLYVFLPLRNKSKALLFAFLWLTLAHAPHSGVFIPANALFLEHWMYLPTIGLLLGLSQWIHCQFEKIKYFFMFSEKIIPITSFSIVFILFIAEGYLTWKQNKVWANPIALYSNNIRYNPLGSARIYNNLAMAYDQEGRVSEAIMTYRESISIQDTYPQTHHNLARSLLRQNNFEDAIKELEAATSMDPNFYHSYGTLSEIYAHLGNQKKSDEYRLRFIEIRKKFFPNEE